MTAAMTTTGAPLRLTASRDGDVAVLRVVGEVDVSNCARLEGRLRDLVEPGRPDRVDRLVVDASALEFLDLPGLRVLLFAEAELRRRGGRLVVQAPGRRVRRLLALLDPEQRLAVEG